ncbi:MAG: hypothetical protein HQK92_11570 [Nitrospirae bacterium]|nr:hypothetical protein [Nitrospirota bacterium]
MKTWTQQVGTFIRLEDYYESITFLDDDKGVIRKSKPLSLTNRIKST